MTRQETLRGNDLQHTHRMTRYIVAFPTEYLSIEPKPALILPDRDILLNVA